MFLTKRHLPRRTVLRGAGVALALPLLDAMTPAAAALAQTAAAPRLRVGFFYPPHGAIMDNTSHGARMDRWTPRGSGAGFEPSPILAPLESHKRYVTSFGNLENRAMVGGVYSLAPATWLSGVRPDGSASGARMAVTLDQIAARHLGGDTALPSLEVAAETPHQAAACSGSRCFYNTTLSFRDTRSPLPMEHNPRKVFVQLFGEGNTRLWLATPTWMPAEDRYRPPRPRLAHPTETFYADGTMTAGRARVDYGYLIAAHTMGDIYVFFRDANVLAAGDVASPARDPALDWFTGAWLGGRVDAMDRLLALSDETRIVPGSGPVMRRADLQAERDLGRGEALDRSTEIVTLLQR